MKTFHIIPMTALLVVLMSGTSLAGGFSHQHGEQNSATTKPAAQEQGEIQAMGKLNTIHVRKHKVNITHGPIPALNWPPMRMDFSVRKGVSLSGLQEGQTVHFMLEKSGEYEYVITKIFPMP